MLKVSLSNLSNIVFSGNSADCEAENNEVLNSIFSDENVKSSFTVKGVPITKQRVMKGAEYLLRGVRAGDKIKKKIDNYNANKDNYNTYDDVAKNTEYYDEYGFQEVC